MSRTGCSRWAVGKGKRRRRRFFGPPDAGKRARNGRLRTRVRCAIITFIAQLLPAEIAPLITSPEIPHDHHRQQSADSPRVASVSAGPAGRRPGVADALTSVLSDNTRRVYGAQWRLFESWCGDVDLRSMPAEPLTVARYLAVRAGSGASIATLRLATSAIAKVHEWGRPRFSRPGPGRARGVEGLGPASGQAPAPGRRPHRRRPRRDPGSPLRNPVPAAAASKRPSRPPSAPASTWPWWPCCPTGGCGAARRRR